MVGKDVVASGGDARRDEGMAMTPRREAPWQLRNEDSDPPKAVFEVVDIEVEFPSAGHRAVTALLGVTLGIRAGEILGVVGETGAGKSLTAWAGVGLLPPPGRLVRGEVRYRGHVIGSSGGPSWRDVRGKGLSIVVQDPKGALNPVLPIGKQIANVVSRRRADDTRRPELVALEMLRAVGLHPVEQRARAYPHQLSGGMAQRALIAMALVNDPAVLIADEPTTGLDVTVQAAILDLMVALVRQRGSSLWLITHDLGIIANYTDRAAVMFAGQVIEEGDTATVFEAPQHPYTRGLVQAANEGATDISPAYGAAPDLANRPEGCQFAYRCPLKQPKCETAMPQLEELAPGHLVRCVVAVDAARARDTTIDG